MPKTPQQRNLQFATQEIDELKKLYNSISLQVKNPLPYKEYVLSALNSCKIFHFTGYRYTDLFDLLKSYLYLKDWESEPLTVASLLETNLRKQMLFLTYFSAYRTGQIKYEKFIDEGLYLISAY